MTLEDVMGAVSNIVEYGSNANGAYIKFGNGVLVCWASKNNTASNYATWTYPVAFVAAPVVWGANNGGENTGLGCSVGTIGASSCRYSLIVFTTGVYYAGTLPCALLAIGRWK